jgi:predicted PurR-regulated permease PerM
MTATPGRTVRLAIGPGAVTVVLLGIAAGSMAFGISSAARRTLGWALACVVVAAVIEPVVARLDRHMPRALATLVTFLAIGAAVGLLVFGVFRDLDTQITRLKEAVPEAAAELEEREGFLGDAARDLDLATRAADFVAELDKPSSGVAVGVASSAGAYFVCAILTIFFLSWGPRLGRAALAQIEDADRRRRAGRLTRRAFSRGRTYILASIGLAVAVGIVAWGLFRLEDAPAPIALAVTVAAGSFIPGVGVIVGAMPAVLLEAGLGSPMEGARLFAAFALVQALHHLVLRRYVSSRTVRPGPAVIVIALVLGYEVYGAGGAFYGAALMVFAVAGLDALGELQAAEDPSRP